MTLRKLDPIPRISEIQLATTDIQKIVVVVATTNEVKHYELDRKFTGRFLLDFNLGGVAGAEKVEKMK